VAIIVSIALFALHLASQPARGADCSAWTPMADKPTQGVSVQIKRCAWDRDNEKVFVRARNDNAYAVAVYVDFYRGSPVICGAVGRERLAAAVHSGRLKGGASTASDFAVVPRGSPFSA
jgi:hypothetical protein